MIGAFHFLRPWWLLALLAIAIAWWWYGRARGRRSPWYRVGDSALVDLLIKRSANASRWRQPRHWLAALAVLAVLALAGPTWERAAQPVFRSQAALVVALDLSTSMLAQDITPSRIQRGRLKIRDLLARRRRGDTALLVYAADSFAITPLTHDVHTLDALLAPLDPSLMPRQGTRPAQALALAGQLVRRGGQRSGDVLLVTDGLGVADPRALIDIARQSGLRVSILAVATPADAPVPQLNGIGYLRNRGHIVTAPLKPAPLRALTEATGGRYQTVRRDAGDIQIFTQFFQNSAGTDHAVAGRDAQRWTDRGPWLILLCLPIAALLFRRNALFGLVLLAGLAAPVPPATAGPVIDLFRNGDQRGIVAYRDGDYAAAQALFTDRRWQAAAAYRQDDFERALALYAPLDDTESIYDRGNVLAHLGQFEAALDAYDTVLARDPDHADAAYNKAQVLDLLRQLGKNAQSGNDDPNNVGDQKNRSKDGRREKQSSDAKNRRAPAGQGAKPPKNADGKRRAAQPPTPGGAAKPDQAQQADSAGSDEARQARKEQALSERQWLRQIPDDPAGLLRRKLAHQYEQRNADSRDAGPPW